jgi:pilus assembly protein Flp/PilA
MPMGTGAFRAQSIGQEPFMLNMLKNLWKDEDAPTAVEYALMVALIAGVIIAGATFLGTQTNTLLTNVGAKVK